MIREYRVFHFLFFLFLFVLISGCSAAAEPPTEVPAPTEEPIVATPTPIIEQRLIEVEWPPTMRLGDSDIVRLSLIPTKTGYVPQVEFEEHDLALEAAEIPFRPGFEVFGIARMNAVGLTFEPSGDQKQPIIQEHVLNWRWSISPENAGKHRFSLELRIRWEPVGEGRIEEVNIWDSALEVQVNAPLGIAAPQARTMGAIGIFVGTIMALPLAGFVARRRVEESRARKVRHLKPNLDVELDVASGVNVSTEESVLLQALYNRHARVVVETRYSSGYSGARTFLVQPTRQDGRTDAFAIVKIGSAREIQAEYSNYETFVRHTLPPVTSRVQGPPVLVESGADAAIEYTFVGMPGVTPTSMKTFVLNQRAAESRELIERGLFATFGTGWWMQRVPYSFRMGVEYDRLLPVHLVLEATNELKEAGSLTGNRSELDGLAEGSLVKLENAMVTEVRPRRNTATLSWINSDFTPPVRVRFQNIHPGKFSEGSKIRAAFGQVVATRESLLKAEVKRCFPSQDFESPHLSIWNRRLDNPLFHLSRVLEKHQAGTRSIIHGDLNLENILVGPGDLVWLIDFASTREGHTLFDFARLEAELTTQALSEIFERDGLGPEQFFKVLDALENGSEPEELALRHVYELLHVTRSVACRILFDPGRQDELYLSLVLAYLGTLKFSNLDDLPHAPLPKVLAFSAAAYLITNYLNSN